MPAVPRLSFAFIDVRDVAAAHVAALTAPGAGGHRFPMGERNLSLLEFANILRRRFPAYAAKLPRFELPDWAVRILLTCCSTQTCAAMGETRRGEENRLA